MNVQTCRGISETEIDAGRRMKMMPEGATVVPATRKMAPFDLGKSGERIWWSRESASFVS